jgi:hypothetical protein
VVDVQSGPPGVVSPRSALEAALRCYRYTPLARDQETIEPLEFGSMVETFLRLTSAGGRPPTQRQFGYVMAHEIGLRPDADVLGRAGRAWTSLVVQYHAKVVLEERYPLVVWDVVADQRYGLDLMVFADDWVPVGLALRVSGASGDRYGARKNGRHEASGLVVRELICDRHEHPVGPFWRFTPERLSRTVEDAAYEARHQRRTGYEDEVYRAGYQQCQQDYGVDS